MLIYLERLPPRPDYRGFAKDHRCGKEAWPYRTCSQSAMGDSPFCTVRRTWGCYYHRRQQGRAVEGELGDLRRGPFASRNCGYDQWCLAVGQREGSLGLYCAADVDADQHVRGHETRGSRSEDLSMIRQKPRAFSALFLLAACSQIPAMEPRME